MVARFYVGMTNEDTKKKRAWEDSKHVITAIRYTAFPNQTIKAMHETRGDMPPQTIVVTGARGFIAAALMARLQSDGHAVVGTDRKDSASIRAVLAATRPSIVIHAAAELYDEAAMFESNVILTRNILEHCKDVSPRCRMVLIGSSSEYGRVDRATTEGDPLRPTTMYEGTKAAAAMLTQGYAAACGFQACVIRPYSVYGPGEKPQRFVRFLLTKPASIRLCPTPELDFIYIDDFVDGVCAVLQRQTKAFDVINLGSGVQTSNARLVETVEAVLGHKFVIEATLPPKSNDACVWKTDPMHAHQKYGFRATTTLEQGVRYMANVLGHLT